MSSSKPVLPLVLLAGSLMLIACSHLLTPDVKTNVAVEKKEEVIADSQIEDNSKEMLKRGREIFRYDTFGSEAFWGGELRLHEAIKGDKHDGVGGGLSPKSALKVGLKVDVEKLPKILGQAIKAGSTNLEDPTTTLALLKADAVVGVRGVFEGDKLTSVGLRCSLCHSTVDDAFAKGIGNRLDGWPNRDLNVGAIVAMAPNSIWTVKEFGLMGKPPRPFCLPHSV